MGKEHRVSCAGRELSSFIDRKCHHHGSILEACDTTRQRLNNEQFHESVQCKNKGLEARSSKVLFPSHGYTFMGKAYCCVLDGSSRTLSYLKVVTIQLSSGCQFAQLPSSKSWLVGK